MPFVDARQKVVRETVAIQIVPVVPRINRSPELKVAACIKLVRRHTPCTRVEPVDELRCLKPRDARCRIIRAARVIRNAKAA